jgi:Skp family chaperone for outer membrane proteins
MAAILALGVFTSGQVLAAELKIGFIDVKSAIENTKQFRAGQRQLEDIKKTKQKELEVLKDHITRMDKDLTSQSMAMSPDRLSRKQRDINDMKKDFKRKLQDAQEEMTLERNRILQGINTKFGKRIREFGKKNNYDLILTRPSVLYVAPKHNITTQITKLLDSGK